MSKIEIKILSNADYLHFGSLKIVGFENLTFRFDTTGKLMPDFWDDRDGYHEMREDEQFYQDIQRALQEKLVDIRFTEVHKNRQPEELKTKSEIEAWLNSEDW